MRKISMICLQSSIKHVEKASSDLSDLTDIANWLDSCMV